MVSLPTSGRGRGRPKKNNVNRSDPTTEDYFRAPMREGGPIDPVSCFFEVYQSIFYLVEDSRQKLGNGEVVADPPSAPVLKVADEKIVRQSMNHYPMYVYLK